MFRPKKLVGKSPFFRSGSLEEGELNHLDVALEVL